MKKGIKLLKRGLVFFIDVDNTLLDNDKLKEGIHKSLIKVLGKEEADHFWQHHDSFRQRKKLVDFPNIIREYCREKHSRTCDIKLDNIFQNTQFKSFLYPQVDEVIKHLKTIGKVVILSEGDMVYQRMKIEKSRIAAMADEVFLYEYKLEHLEQLIRQHGLYKKVFIEDRLDILAEIKQKYPTAFTILVCQGHYAKPDCPRKHEGADLAIENISDLLTKLPKDI